jgi:hypothetical protein
MLTSAFEFYLQPVGPDTAYRSAAYPGKLLQPRAHLGRRHREEVAAKTGACRGFNFLLGSLGERLLDFELRDREKRRTQQ